VTGVPAETLADVRIALNYVHAVANDVRDEMADALQAGVRSGPRMDRLHRMVNHLGVVRGSLIGILEQEDDRS
jgi:hypothetical protein